MLSRRQTGIRLYWLGCLGLLVLGGCSPAPRVKQNADNTYSISETGGWGYNEAVLKRQVKEQAEAFARSAGKRMLIVDEGLEPDSKVNVYPADEDTYTLTFRLTDR
jgi:hypothetical protein